MTVNPADSPVLGALYGTDAMRAVMGERAFLQKMLDVEAALARAEARLGIVPAPAAAAIGAAADVARLDLPALAAATRNTGYPVVGLVAQLSALAGAEAGRWTHWGATTQDIMDTAVVLQAVARTLPAHMVPARIELADALPVTPNGKVDYKRLVAERVAPAAVAVAAPA